MDNRMLISTCSRPGVSPLQSRIVAMVSNLEPGCTYDVFISHDSWCEIDEDRWCNCDPDIEIRRRIDAYG